MKRQQDLDHSPRTKRSRGYSSRENLIRDRLSPESDHREMRGESRRIKRDLSPSPPPPRRSDYDYDGDRSSSKRRTRDPDTYYNSRLDRSPPDYPPRIEREYRSDYRGGAAERQPRSRISPEPPGPPPMARDEFRSLCISKIDPEPSDMDVKDALIPIFKRYGEFNVKVVHMGANRLAYINFRFPDDAEAALRDKSKFLLFDGPVRVEPVFNRGGGTSHFHRTERANMIAAGRNVGRMGRSTSPDGPDRDSYSARSISPPMRGNNPRMPRDDRPPMRGPPTDRGAMGGFRNDRGVPGGDNERRPAKEPKFPHHMIHIPPEDDDKATRTLFVGNLDIEIDDVELFNIFERFGCIEDVDIKRPMNPNQGNAYAFIRLLTLDMAYRAKCNMSGQYIGRFQCKIGYGKVTPTHCLWIGGLGPWVTLETIEREFDRFGVINKIEWTNGKDYAYVLYDSIDAAQAANQEMRGFPLGGPERKLRIDFANPEFIDPAVTAKLENLEHRPVREPQPLPPGYDGTWVQPPPGQPQAPPRDFQRRDRHLGPGGNGPPPEYGEIDGNGERKRTPMPEDNRDFDSPLNNSRDGRHNDRDLSPRRRYHGDGNADARNLKRPEDRDSTVLKHVTKFSELVKCIPAVWSGVLVLKNSGFPARLHLVRGDMRLVDSLMKDTTSEVSCLRITQRLRLDQPKLEDVGQRIAAAGPHGHCILLAVPSSSQSGVDESIQQRPLKNLVSYLKQKDAAGVVTLPPSPPKDKDAVGVLHAFPPCQFGHDFLHEIAPNMGNEPAKEDHIVIVVVKGAS